MRRPGQLKRSPLKRQSAKKKAGDAALRKAREAVMERAGGVCEVCVRAVATQAHHRLPRSQGGQHTEDALLAVCSNCHRTIHENPHWAYELGLLWRRP